MNRFVIRRPDPRIAEALMSVIDGAPGVLNVLSRSRFVRTHRSAGDLDRALEGDVSPASRAAHPAVRAVAEFLPIRDKSVEASTAILTIHHWKYVD
jgi:hypothetical protein